MVFRGFYHAMAGLFERRFVFNKKLDSIRELGITKPHIWKSRNGLLDIDINLHMNNASFVYLAELARWRLSGVGGLLSAAFKNKWTFMVGSQSLRYRYPIPPFVKYQIVTTVDAVDDQWLYMTQTFTSPTIKPDQKPKRVYAQASIRAIVVGLDGTKASPQRVLKEMGFPEEKFSQLAHPSTVDSFKAMLEWDKASAKSMKDMTL